jgi:DNA-binding CsgD family transcriptional regulator
MFNMLNPAQLLNKILGFQKDFFAHEVGKTPVIKDSYINEFSKSENSVRLIFDQVNLKILYISENVAHLTGHSMTDFMELNILFALKLFTLEHYNFLYVWIKWALDRHSKYGDTFNSKQALCGIKVNHKEGHTMRLLFRHYALEETADGIPTVSAITIDDISHLMKADFYWGRIECGKGEKHTYHMVSTDKENIAHDILSDREKDTLRLLAQGKESKEIGELLHISSHTVDNHRRNMLHKLGVRDTTGLVQICKMVGII